MKQQDFLKQQSDAQKRVHAAQERVEATQAAYDAALKNKLLRNAERLANTLKRQQTALAVAKAELAEWSTLK